MDREEILAKSRRENKNRDLEEKEALAWAAGIAIRVGLLICCLLSVLEVLFQDRVSTASWTIFFGTLGTTMVLKYIRLRRRHELAAGVLYMVLCAGFFALHIRSLLGGA